ncbi:hypothetical protein RJT34_23712 [Clitoria ternatea]|uniref:Uncharacterized protein n=1 Tax=Clitoria ternatea TaxID=43366 RepID=A0AAN9IGT8_CLITE
MINFLPHEQHRQDEVKKVFARAATLEPAESSPKHVYPKLPDHDDLATRPQEEDKDINGTILVNDKVKEMDEKFQVFEKTKSAMSAAERSVASARSPIIRNCYMFTRAAWVTGAYNRVAKKAEQVGQKTKEKFWQRMIIIKERIKVMSTPSNLNQPNLNLKPLILPHLKV